MSAFVHINKHENAPLKDWIGLKHHDIKWMNVWVSDKDLMLIGLRLQTAFGLIKVFWKDCLLV